MTRDGIRFHQNLTSRDPCPVCHDDGFVELAGTQRINGYNYSRGSAPCHWCEAGVKAYAASKKRTKAHNGASHYSLASDYTIHDVANYDPHPTYPSKAEAKKLLASILPHLDQP